MGETSSETAGSGEASSDPPLTCLGFATMPLILWIMDGSAEDVASAMMAVCLLVIALRLLARGHVLALRHERTQRARAPRIPRKLFGALSLGALVTLLSGHHFVHPAPPVLLGILGTVLSILAFGLDPIRDKGARPLRSSAEKPGQSATPEVAGMNDREIFSIAFDGLVAEVKHVDDRDLCNRIETLRALLLGRLDDVSGNDVAFEHMSARARRILLLLAEETERLIADQAGPRADFARQRYAAKVDVLTRKISDSPPDPGRVGRRGPLDKRADKLFARMRQESTG